MLAGTLGRGVRGGHGLGSSQGGSCFVSLWSLSLSEGATQKAPSSSGGERPTAATATRGGHRPPHPHPQRLCAGLSVFPGILETTESRSGRVVETRRQVFIPPLPLPVSDRGDKSPQTWRLKTTHVYYLVVREVGLKCVSGA